MSNVKVMNTDGFFFFPIVGCKTHLFCYDATASSKGQAEICSNIQ